MSKQIIPIHLLLVFSCFFYSCSTAKVSNNNSATSTSSKFKSDNLSKSLEIEKLDGGVYLAPDRKTKYKPIVLDNGLQVNLIHNENFEKTGIQVSVGTGLELSPDGKLGMAHFLEHMLFISSKKYPKLNGYIDFVQSHGGDFDASTDYTHTKYSSLISNRLAQETIDRLAQFFINPVFIPEFVKKEKNAVNSEYLILRVNDEAKLSYLLKQFNLKNESKKRRFAVGSVESMKNIGVKDLQDFYNKYYFASNMRVAVTSSLPLKTMEKYIKDSFSDVKDKDRKIEFEDYQMFNKDMIGKSLTMKSSNLGNHLLIDFPIYQSTNDFFNNKYLDVIKYILEDEEEGSLVAYLKNKGLISQFEIEKDKEFMFETANMPIFRLSFTLTKKGKENKEEIVKSSLLAIKKLKNEGIKDYVLSNMTTLKNLDIVYPSKALDEIEYIMDFSTPQLLSPFDKVIKHFYNGFDNLNKKGFDKTMSFLNPDNFYVIDLLNGAKTDKKISKWYNIDYSISNFNPELINSIRKEDVVNFISYIKPNSFIPKDFSILKSQGSDETLENIMPEDGLFFFEKDKTVNQPYASIILTLQSNKSKTDSEGKKRLLASILKRMISQWAYPAKLAKINYSISDTDFGIKIKIDSFSDVILPFFTELAKRISELKISQSAFSDTKASLIEQINAAKYQYTNLRQSMNQAESLVSDLLTYDEQIEQVKNQSLDSIKDFYHDILNNTRIYGAAYGNLHKKDVKNALMEFKNNIAYKVSQDEIKYKFPRFKPGTSVKVAKESDNPTDTSYTRYVLNTSNFDLKSYLIANIFAITYDARFSNDLRTKQSVGYIVDIITYQQQAIPSFVFIAQSNKYESDKIGEMFDKWIEDIKGEFELGKVDKELFEEVKESKKDSIDDLANNINTKVDQIYDDKASPKQIFTSDQIKKAIDNLSFDDYKQGVLNILDSTKNAQIDSIALKKGAEIPSEYINADDAKSLLYKDVEFK